MTLSKTIIYFLSLHLIFVSKVVSDEPVSAVLYVSVNDTSHIVDDSLFISHEEFQMVIDEMKLKSIQKVGYCDYLCGSSGMWLKISQLSSDTLNNIMYIDFGFGCQKTKEACVNFGIDTPVLVFSYGEYTEKLLNNAWKNVSSKHKK